MQAECGEDGKGVSGKGAVTKSQAKRTPVVTPMSAAAVNVLPRSLWMEEVM
jgi:hypothetical protein